MNYLAPLAAGVALCSFAHAQDHHVSIEEGHITLLGNFNQLAGIEVISVGGFLSVADLRIVPDLFVPSKEPFSLSDGFLVANSPHHVVIGVLGADKRIDFEGQTRTAILFGNEETPSCAELTVNVGLGDAAPVKVQHGLCPEPSTAFLASGFFGLICLRKRRSH